MVFILLLVMLKLKDQDGMLRTVFQEVREEMQYDRKFRETHETAYEYTGLVGADFEPYHSNHHQKRSSRG